MKTIIKLIVSNKPRAIFLSFVLLTGVLALLKELNVL